MTSTTPKHSKVIILGSGPAGCTSVATPHLFDPGSSVRCLPRGLAHGLNSITHGVKAAADARIALDEAEGAAGDEPTLGYMPRVDSVLLRCTRREGGPDMAIADASPVTDTAHDILDLRHRRRETAFHQFVQAAHLQGAVMRPELLESVLNRRERLGSTALGKGFVLTGAWTLCVRRPLVLVGLSEKGLDWDAADGRELPGLSLNPPAIADQQQELAKTLVRFRKAARAHPDGVVILDADEAADDVVEAETVAVVDTTAELLGRAKPRPGRARAAQSGSGRAPAPNRGTHRAAKRAPSA